MDDVLLVTCAEVPEGEIGGDLIVAALADQGLSARWVSWDDPEVDWSAASVVAVRSTWDYEWRREEFLGWARSVGPALLNGAEVFTWNTDKAYLVALGEAGVRIVPTVSVDEEAELAPALADLMPAVVKPRVGAGGRGVVLFDGEPAAPDEPSELDESRLTHGPWIVQPLVPSVRTDGEISVFVIGGEAVAQVVKRPPAGSKEIRVHEWYGGASQRTELTEEAATLSVEAVRAVERLLDVPLPYARADLMRLEDGALAVGEVELTEPGFYLDLVPEVAEAFAGVITGLVAPVGERA